MKIASQIKEDETARIESFNCAFPRGIVGFPDCTGYRIESEASYEPFLKMKSLDREDVQFILMDPWIVKSDYRFELSDQDLETLSLEDPSHLMIITVVTIYRKESRISLNLAAPIAVNTKKCIGIQLILDDKTHPLRHYVPLSA